MDNKAQVSLEVVLVVGVAVLVFISLFNVWWARMSMARDVGEAGEARMVGEVLAESINSVYTNGVNFSITFSEEEINYSRLGDKGSIGGWMSLPISVNASTKTIKITKNMSKTGGSSANWATEISYFPPNVTRLDATTEFPQTTIRFNGSHVIIYASSSNIEVVS